MPAKRKGKKKEESSSEEENPNEDVLQNTVIALAGTLKNTRNHYSERITQYGGTYATTISGRVTQVLSSQDEYDKKTNKINQALRHQIPIVTEEWLEDSITKGILQNEQNYRLDKEENDEDDGKEETEEDYATFVEDDEAKEKRERKLKENFRKNLVSLIDDTSLSDLIFRVEPKGDSKEKPKEFFAHRALIAKQSPVLAEMIQKGEKKDGKILVAVSDTKPSIFKMALEAMYAGMISPSSSQVFDLLTLCDKFKLGHVADWLRTSFYSPNNICLILQDAHEKKRDDVFSWALRYLENNASEALETEGFLSLSKEVLALVLDSDRLAITESELFESLIQWADAQISKGNGETSSSVTKMDVESSSKSKTTAPEEKERFPFFHEKNANTNTSTGGNTVVEEKNSNTSISGNTSISSSTTTPSNTQIDTFDSKKTGRRKKKEVDLEEEKKKELRINLLEGLTQKVRFGLMTAEEINQNVEPYGLVPDKILLESYKIIAAKSDPKDSILGRPRNLGVAKSLKSIHSRLIKDLVKPYRLRTVLFQASKDGWSNQEFHKLCDGEGPTVTVVVAKNGFVYGGFTSIGFSSNGNYVADNKAFLFRLSDGKTVKSLKLKVKPNMYNAIYQNSGYGPTFGGGHDLYVNLNQINSSYSNLGYSFETGSGQAYDNTFLAGTYNNWSLEDVLVISCKK